MLTILFGKSDASVTHNPLTVSWKWWATNEYHLLVHTTYDDAAPKSLKPYQALILDVLVDYYYNFLLINHRPNYNQESSWTFFLVTLQVSCTVSRDAQSE